MVPSMGLTCDSVTAGSSLTSACTALPTVFSRISNFMEAAVDNMLKLPKYSNLLEYEVEIT